MYSTNKSLNFGQYVSNDKVLNRKVPENPRFKHVKAAIDTGKNVKRHIDELKEKQKNFNYKKDEVFNRVKFSAFIKLAINVAKDNLKQENAKDFSPRDGVNTNEAGNEDKCKIANVLVGIGEIDLRNEKKKTPTHVPKVEKRTPYLLLDVRDRDDFLQCHIKTAKHYPSAMLSRSTGYELDEMKVYKNKQLDLIIVYDDDESIASRVATTLVQRGYENVYLLSGGLRLGFDVFPRALMASITTGYSPTFKTSSVQVRTSSAEHFSQEDIDYITQYIEDYPTRGNPTLSSKSCTSYVRSDKSGPKGSHLSCQHLSKSLLPFPPRRDNGISCTSSLAGRRDNGTSSFAGRRDNGTSCTSSLAGRRDNGTSSSRSHLEHVRFRTTSSKYASSDCRTKVAVKKAPWK